MSTLNNEINNYINNVCSFIKNKKVHEEIKLELQSHIQDLIDEYISSGITKEESINKALMEMGPADVVGADLNKTHKTNSDWLLLIFTTSLILFGLYTMSFIQKVDSANSVVPNIMLKSILILLLSILISLVFIKIDFRSIKKYSKHIYVFSIVLMLFTHFTSPTVYGIRNYIIIGSFSFKTSDIACLLLIISLAGIFDNYNWNNKKSLFKGLVLVLAPCLLFILIPSLSSLILYLISAFSIMLLSGFKIKYMLVSISTLSVIFVGYLFLDPYRINRLLGFLTFLDPTRDPEGSTYIYNQIFNLKNSASIIGNQNIAALSSLPDAHTDFVLTSILYSFGWLIAIILSAVILAFIIRIIFIGNKTKNSYGKLLIFGICALFASQFIFCILSSLLLLPALGFTMPFISYGGTSLLINILAVSLINNIYKNRNIPYNSSI